MTHLDYTSREITSLHDYSCVQSLLSLSLFSYFSPSLRAKILSLLFHCRSTILPFIRSLYARVRVAVLRIIKFPTSRVISRAKIKLRIEISARLSLRIRMCEPYRQLIYAKFNHRSRDRTRDFRVLRYGSVGSKFVRRDYRRRRMFNKNKHRYNPG